MKIHIDEKCAPAAGRCYSLSPDLVQANDEGYPVQLGQDIDAGHDEEEAPPGRGQCPQRGRRVSSAS